MSTHNSFLSFFLLLLLYICVSHLLCRNRLFNHLTQQQQQQKLNWKFDSKIKLGFQKLNRRDIILNLNKQIYANTDCHIQKK